MISKRFLIGYGSGKTYAKLVPGGYVTLEDAKRWYADSILPIDDEDELLGFTEGCNYVRSVQSQQFSQSSDPKISKPVFEYPWN